MPENEMSDDGAVIERVVTGERDEFRKIVLKHQRSVFAAALAITRNQADASDVTQEVFIRFYRHIEQFDASRPLSAYLMRIARNLSIDVVRKKAIRAKHEHSIKVERIDERRDPSEELETRETAGRIRELVGELPLRQREVCSLFYLAGMSCAETANVLGITENMVKVSLCRARKSLLDKISGLCGQTV